MYQRAFPKRACRWGCRFWRPAMAISPVFSSRMPTSRPRHGIRFDLPMLQWRSRQMGALALNHIAWLAAALAMAGACTGILAGLFGVGGGTVIVPVLYEVFRRYGVPDEVLMPLCVGTSLAVIVPTSIASFASHYKKGAVDVAVLRTWTVPIVLG